MSLKKYLSYNMAILSLLLAVSCSGGGTFPAQDGGSPQNDDSARISGLAILDGTPAEGVEVAAYDVSNGSMVSSDSTSPDGKYGLYPLGGQYLIVAAGPNGYSIPEPINVANDDSKYNFNIQLRPFEGQDKGFLFCRIVNENDNTPVPNAIIKFGDKQATTNVWGFCLLVGIKEQDAYQLDIQARGFNNKIQEIRKSSFNRIYILTAEFFKLTPKSDIGSSIGGVVRDIGTGIDLGGVYITIEKPNDPAFQSLTYMTNLGGYYRFYNLQKGTYWIFARRIGYIEDKAQAIINDEDGYYNIFLTPDVEQQGTLTGFVYDATGNIPIPNVQVTISNPLFGVNKDTISGGDGSFIFTGLVFGDYYLRTIPPTALFLPQHVTLTVNEEAQRIEFNLPYNNSGALMGEVTTTDVGKPATGAQIIAEKIGAPMSGLKFETNVDPKGQYAINGMMQGIYRVKVLVEYAGDKKTEAVEESVPINPGAATIRDFEIEPVE